MAVWSLGLGYLALAVAVAGLIVMSSGSTLWVLAVGVIIWLAAAAITLTGFFWVRHELPEPRRGSWWMRFMLILGSALLDQGRLPSFDPGGTTPRRSAAARRP